MRLSQMLNLVQEYSDKQESSFRLVNAVRQVKILVKEQSVVQSWIPVDCELIFIETVEARFQCATTNSPSVVRGGFVACCLTIAVRWFKRQGQHNCSRSDCISLHMTL